MTKMTPKEKMYTKAQKMTDLILDGIPKDGGEKSLSSEFYDYKSEFKYEISLTIKKTKLIENELIEE